MTFRWRQDVPPFPDDLPCARVPIISLAKLHSNDQQEAAKLLSILRNDGIFYLNLQSCDQGLHLLNQSEDLLDLAKEVFKVSDEEKLRCAMDPQIDASGYKPMGTVKTTDDTLRPDSTEFFKVKKDHLFGIAPTRPYPEMILREKDLLKRFAASAHQCSMIVLRALESQLDLPHGTFTSVNVFERPSHDNVLLTHKPAKPEPDPTSIGLVSHTDFGSVTILFNWIGGLQIQQGGMHRDTTEQEWLYIRPVPGMAIVNLGDAMAMFTDGLLPAIKHRVVPMPPGCSQATEPRYSVVYFAKPNDDVLLHPLDHFNIMADASTVKANHSQGVIEDRDRKLRVGGKFTQYDGQDKVYTAGQWSKQREIVISATGHC